MFSYFCRNEIYRNNLSSISHVIVYNSYSPSFFTNSK